MKKLMFVAALAAAMTGLADVSSANVVGYCNTDGRAKNNFYTPCFQHINGTPVTIQDIQIDANVETFEANIQILDDNRKFIGEMYQWVMPEEIGDYPTLSGQVPEGMGAWVNTQIRIPEINPLEFGQVVQVYLPDDGNLKSNGEVCDDDYQLLTGRAKNNFVGNPYPADMSIQNIQIPANVETFEANIQILDDNRKFIGEMYQWVMPEEIGDYPTLSGQVPEGMGAWVNTQIRIPDIPALKPGEGVQVYLPSAGQITVYSPIEL